MIPREPVPPPMRQRQHPLTDRHVRPAAFESAEAGLQAGDAEEAACLLASPHLPDPPHPRWPPRRTPCVSSEPYCDICAFSAIIFATRGTRSKGPLECVIGPNTLWFSETDGSRRNEAN